MLKRTINFNTVIFFSAVVFLAPTLAHAGLIDCVRWLTGQKARPQKLASTRYWDPYYQSFVDAKAKNPSTQPPTRLYTAEVSNYELLMDFRFWWYPGNLWHRIMLPTYGLAAAEIQADQDKTGMALPPPETVQPALALVASEPPPRLDSAPTDLSKPAEFGTSAAPIDPVEPGHSLDSTDGNFGSSSAPNFDTTPGPSSDTHGGGQIGGTDPGHGFGSDSFGSMDHGNFGSD